MGTYFNPGSMGFKNDSSDLIYIGKTGLLRILNKYIGTSMRCVALSNARRFGKSQAAGMIEAYYSRGCDSKVIFLRFEIAKVEKKRFFLQEFFVIKTPGSTSVW